MFSNVHNEYFKAFTKPTHSGRLERWLGTDVVEHISERMRMWHGPPIAIAGVPGRVYACRGGDFCGPVDAGWYWTFTDYAVARYRRIMRKWSREQARTLGMGFASLSDLIAEATTGGKKQVISFQKVGIAAPAAGASQDLWRLGNLPPAGANASTADAGTVYDNTVTGTLKQTNAGVGDTLHFVSGYMVSNVSQGSSLLLRDKLFAVNRNYNSTAAQAITGVPTRYQTAALAPGNFQFTNVTTALGATASNVTLTYVDQDGNTAEAGPAQVVRVSSAIDTNPLTQPLWFYLLNAGDTGLRNLTNFQLSAAMGAGNADRDISHPIAIFPGINLANTPVFLDGINSAFNLERVFDGAALSFIEWFKSATAAATYTGSVTLVSG